MRTRATLGGIFASTAILIVGWQAGTAALSSTSSTTSSTSATSASNAGAASAPVTGGTTATPGASSVAGTYTGTSIDTRYGAVQVQITVDAGKITEVTALHLTTAGGRSVQISNRAAPILRSEVLASQSAKVATVSGATYTSDAYLTSLQSAIDQAGL